MIRNAQPSLRVAWRCHVPCGSLWDYEEGDHKRLVDFSTGIGNRRDRAGARPEFVEAICDAITRHGESLSVARA